MIRKKQNDLKGFEESTLSIGKAASSASLDRRSFLKMAGGFITLATMHSVSKGLVSAPLNAFEQNSLICPPGWQGTELIGGESLTNWSVESDAGSSGDLTLVPGQDGQAVQLNWDIGLGTWVQGKYSFPVPVDLSTADIFGVSLKGSGVSELVNMVTIMFADVNGVFYGHNIPGKERGINQLGCWLTNLPFTKKQFNYFWGNDADPVIDWSKIDRFFLVVRKTCEIDPVTNEEVCFGGGSGQLALDYVQYDKAEEWSHQSEFESALADPLAVSKAIDYILSQQDSTIGLFVSWKEEEMEQPPAKAWLYDMALVLLVLTRFGIWFRDDPTHEIATAAKKLVDFISSQQKEEGYWPRAWNVRNGSIIEDDGWVGDQAWWVLALVIYAQKSGDVAALESAQHGAEWLASLIDSDGKVVDSTEGNVDVWFAMIATKRCIEAARIKAHLDSVWDKELHYWWRGVNDPVISMDSATWMSAFARHSTVNQPERAKKALSFVRKTLATSSKDGGLCGFDGMGPVSVWFEGTAQFVAAGGEDAQIYLDMLISQQKPDGAMPSSTENLLSDAFGWHTKWRGLAPTCWLIFAITGMPYSAIKCNCSSDLVCAESFFPIIIKP